MTKNLKYFFIFLFLLSCGYTPVYQIKKDTNIRKQQSMVFQFPILFLVGNLDFDYFRCADCVRR